MVRVEGVGLDWIHDFKTRNPTRRFPTPNDPTPSPVYIRHSSFLRLVTPDSGLTLPKVLPGSLEGTVKRSRDYSVSSSLPHNEGLGPGFSVALKVEQCFYGSLGCLSSCTVRDLHLPQYPQTRRTVSVRKSTTSDDCNTDFLWFDLDG